MLNTKIVDTYKVVLNATQQASLIGNYYPEKTNVTLKTSNNKDDYLFFDLGIASDYITYTTEEIGERNDIWFKVDNLYEMCNSLKTSGYSGIIDLLEIVGFKLDDEELTTYLSIDLRNNKLVLNFEEANGHILLNDLNTIFNITYTYGNGWKEYYDIVVAPTQFVKVVFSKTISGVDKVITFENDIESFTMERSNDLIGMDLPYDKVTFSVKNIDDRFNPENPSGINEYFYERELINVYFGLKTGNENVEWTNAGQYYLTEWNYSELEMTFTAESMMTFMDNEIDVNSLGSENIYDLIKEICHSSSSSQATEFIKVSVDSRLENQTYYDIDTSIKSGNIYMCKRSNILQYIFNAYSLYGYYKWNGFNVQPTLMVKSWEYDNPLEQDETDYEIKELNEWSYPTYDRKKELQAIVINEKYRYVLDVPVLNGITQEISNPFFNPSISIMMYNACGYMADYLSLRNNISGEYRANPILEPLDIIQVETKYNYCKVLITSIKYTFNGAFVGNFEGVVLSSVAKESE